jgi:hypothetical protein
VGFENEYDPDKGFGYRVIQESVIQGVKILLWYTHLSWSYVFEGHKVGPNDLIALTGNTGFSQGPHIHFQARKKDTGKFYDIKFAGHK